MNMKQILLMMAMVGCGTTKADSPPPASHEVDPNAPANFSDPNVERAVRKELKKIRVELQKPEGELTNADLAKLTRLIFGYTEISREGLNLKDVAKLQNLTSLNLHTTQITDAGIKELAKLQNLESLSMFRTKVTKEGVAELKKALPKCRIVGP